ncbi:MAG: aminodeoxychorismate synthase component I [Gammaproteobacteria bacterium]|nr:aminodeoxychorismate synthase component I [Gammaproteobacteria bacterium]
MRDYLIAEIPYSPDSSVLFDKFADETWSVFLDSNQPEAIHGRYDIISSRPKVCITSKNNKNTIDSWPDSLSVPGDPFSILKEYLQVNKSKDQELKFPFLGGAIGYFSYDLGRTLEKLPSIAEDDLSLPDMKVGIYSWAIIVDHNKKNSVLVGDKTDLRMQRNWNDLVSYVLNKTPLKKRQEFNVLSDVESNMSEDTYAQAFTKIKSYIREGDCYQANLAQRFNASIEGDVWQAYCLLRSINPSPFSAYLNYKDFQILSNSPERFLSVKEDIVQTKPIKGTRPRSKNSHEDGVLLQELINSKKDQAENVMIVDLLRNDISKNCALGSVKVPKLFDIESYPNVHHMVSTITGKLRENRSTIDLLRGSFPGGSITGAPKLRSMEIIEELEPHRRGIYCGAIGYISSDGNMDTNIAIRTILHKDQKMYFYAGGGIVYDSEVNAEYQETFDKATAMMQVLNQGRQYAQGR